MCIRDSLVGASVLGGLYDPAHGDVKLFDTVFNLLAVVPVDLSLIHI